MAIRRNLDPEKINIRCVCKIENYKLLSDYARSINPEATTVEECLVLATTHLPFPHVEAGFILLPETRAEAFKGQDVSGDASDLFMIHYSAKVLDMKLLGESAERAAQLYEGSSMEEVYGRNGYAHPEMLWEILSGQMKSVPASVSGYRPVEFV
ncbi:hypothetical protein ACI2KR_30070 [Pseudomonas luteola]